MVDGFTPITMIGSVAAREVIAMDLWPMFLRWDWGHWGGRKDVGRPTRPWWMWTGWHVVGYIRIYNILVIDGYRWLYMWGMLCWLNLTKRVFVWMLSVGYWLSKYGWMNIPAARLCHRTIWEVTDVSYNPGHSVVHVKTMAEWRPVGTLDIWVLSRLMVNVFFLKIGAPPVIIVYITVIIYSIKQKMFGAPYGKAFNRGCWWLIILVACTH